MRLIWCLRRKPDLFNALKKIDFSRFIPAFDGFFRQVWVAVGCIVWIAAIGLLEAFFLMQRRASQGIGRAREWL